MDSELEEQRFTRPGDGEPVADLLRRLSAQTQTLVRQELELARLEATAKGKRFGLGAGMLGGAGVVSLFAVGALTAAAILALAIVLPGWAAALIVAGIWLAVAGVLALTGRGAIKRAMPPVPEQTTETLKEDVAWTKQRAAAGRR